MSATGTRLAVTLCAAMTLACGGRDHAESDAIPPSVTPGETAGTMGPRQQTIKVAGCLTRAEPGGFVLTSIDDAVLRHETGTSGHHRDDPDTKPNEANRGAEDERTRHAQNPSAELGRYRLTGDAERIGMHVDREVEVSGRVESRDNQNETVAVIHVEAIDATGASCAAKQERGNDRGVLPGQH